MKKIRLNKSECNAYFSTDLAERYNLLSILFETSGSLASHSTEALGLLSDIKQQIHCCTPSLRIECSAECQFFVDTAIGSPISRWHTADIADCEDEDEDEVILSTNSYSKSNSNCIEEH